MDTVGRNSLTIQDAFNIHTCMHKMSLNLFLLQRVKDFSYYEILYPKVSITYCLCVTGHTHLQQLL